MTTEEKIAKLEEKFLRDLDERLKVVEERTAPPPEPEGPPAGLMDKPYRDMTPDEKVQYTEQKYGSGDEDA